VYSWWLLQIEPSPDWSTAGGVLEGGSGASEWKNGAKAEVRKAGKNCIHAIFTHEFSGENSQVLSAKK